MVSDRARRSLLVAGGVGGATLVTFVAFRALDLLHLIPAGRETAAALALVGAAAAGGSAAAVQLLPRSTRQRRLGRASALTLVASSTVLVGLHAAFVHPEPDASGDRVGSVVISWSRAGCEGETVDCRGQTRDDCLKGLS